MPSLWSQSNGYMSTGKLSSHLRSVVQPLTRFRQFCDVEEALGKNRGDTVSWNVYGDTTDEAGDLAENEPMPETDFPVTQASVTVGEKGIAVPYSAKFDDLSEHPVRNIINKTLKNNCRRALDTSAHAQFDSTMLKLAATSGTSTTAVTLTDTGTQAVTNNVELGFPHIKAISDLMAEREIPTFDGEHYVTIARPSTFRPMRDDLESIHQYVSEGWNRIMSGETGRAEGIRFVTQTHVANGAWTNGASDDAYFFGADTVTEVVTCPEEIRGKLPDDYGRGRGVAWYYLGAFGILHNDQTSAETKVQGRILHWSSAA